MVKGLSVFLMLLVVGLGAARAAAPAVPKVVVLSMDIINSTLLPTTPEEKARLDAIKVELGAQLEKSGRYQVLPLSPELAAKVAARPNIPGCAGCQIDWGREAGADLVVWGNVQKVSNLILNINVYMDDVASGKPYFGTSVDIRGNTDESWMRGIRYLVKNNILKE